MKNSITKTVLSISIILSFISCQQIENGVSEEEFRKLMKNITNGWSTQNTQLALNCFTENAIYIQPPDIQFYQGHSQLKPYFDELTDKHKMRFHNLWFDIKSQTGVGEFTFSYGKETSDVGIVVVELEKGKIKLWREYLTKGQTDFNRFLSTENKEWQWHIGNYPAPKDTSKK